MDSATEREALEAIMRKAHAAPQGSGAGRGTPRLRSTAMSSAAVHVSHRHASEQTRQLGSRNAGTRFLHR